jgi:hypothetical protein
MVEVSTVNSLQNHLKHLEEIHRKLDKKIERNYNHYLNDIDLKKLKLEKLTLKEEIEKLKLKIEDKKSEGKRKDHTKD